MDRLARLLERPWLRWGLLLGTLAVAAAVRLATYPWVYGGDEIRTVADGDVLYHLLQAGRLVNEGLGAVWRDPGLNYPLGADVPWPPLFDALIAGAGWLSEGLSRPGPEAILAGGVWVPLLLGVAMVALLAWMGRALLGGRPWLDAALVLALLPAHAKVTPLGRADQHALEPVLLGLMVLAAAWLARAAAGEDGDPAAGRTRARAAVLLAAGAALSFWNWNGSALYLAVVAGFAAAWHVLAPPGDPLPRRTAGWLAGSLLGGAFLLAVSVALLGARGAIRSAGLSGLTGLQPALVAGTALACALLWAARRWRPEAGWPERSAAAAAALLLPPVLLLTVPWTSEGLGHGLTMLAARGWYRTILEFRPLLPSGLAPLTTDLENVLAANGLAPLAVLAALPFAWRRLQSGPPEGRGPALLFGVLAVFGLAAGWLRNRFGLYLAVAEALALALVARALWDWLAARWPARPWAGPAAAAALLAVAVAPVLPGLPAAEWASLMPARYTTLAPLARLAGTIPTLPGREAVLAPWSHGHDLRYFSGRPVVSSPFGIEGGAGALEVDAAFHRTVDQRVAETLLSDRRVGLVVISEPLDEVVSLEAFAPPDAIPVYAAIPEEARVDRVRVLAPFQMLIVTRLWLWDGMWGRPDGQLLEEGPPAVDAFRLVGESSGISIWQAVGVPEFKLFQPVDGARVTVRGARPGAVVTARTRLRTPRGRMVEWHTHAIADAAGLARLRLPYAAGLNGSVEASPWRVEDGRGATGVAPSELDVLLGRAIEAALR